jgi:leucyl/phenylalanyl-tRNA--protein transferase
VKRIEQRPLLLRPGDPTEFPNPDLCDDEGLVAIGGDLSSERLMQGYRQGIFPWYNEGFPLLWWCPNPRAVISLDRLHVSQSMRRLIRHRTLRVTWNRAFADVILACGENRPGGTWILPEMRAAYERLHALGCAHSVEVWKEGALVGGLYGVQCGAVFAAESMFHSETNASKVALVAAVKSAFHAGIELFDVQFATPHLKTLGVYEVQRSFYLKRVKDLTNKTVDLRAPALLV